MSTFDGSSVGKRLSKDDPLGPHDVADRLDRAALRTWRIILLAQEAGEDFTQAVRQSRYLTNALAELRGAIDGFLDPSPPDRCPECGDVARLDQQPGSLYCASCGWHRP